MLPQLRVVHEYTEMYKVPTLNHTMSYIIDINLTFEYIYLNNIKCLLQSNYM